MKGKIKQWMSTGFLKIIGSIMGKTGKQAICPEDKLKV